MTDKKKIKCNMMVTPEFWEDWQAMSASVGLSASAMFELTGRAMLDSSKGLIPVMDHLLKVGAKIGKSAPKGRKK